LPGFFRLYRSLHFVGAQTSGANVDGFNRFTVYDLQLFDIGLPRSVGPPGNLAAGNADSMSGSYRLLTNVAFGHDKISFASNVPQCITISHTGLICKFFWGMILLQRFYFRIYSPWQKEREYACQFTRPEFFDAHGFHQRRNPLSAGSVS
jgi:hypothetical protein